MGRLLDVFRVLSLRLSGRLLGGLGVRALDRLVLAGDMLVEVDPASLLVANGALERAQLGVLKLSSLSAKIGGILDGSISEEPY